MEELIKTLGAAWSARPRPRARPSGIGNRSSLLADSAGDWVQITALCYRLYPFPMDSNLRVITERQ